MPNGQDPESIDRALAVVKGGARNFMSRTGESRFKGTMSNGSDILQLVALISLSRFRIVETGVKASLRMSSTRQ